MKNFKYAFHCCHVTCMNFTVEFTIFDTTIGISTGTEPSAIILSATETGYVHHGHFMTFVLCRSYTQQENNHNRLLERRKYLTKKDSKDADSD